MKQLPGWLVVFGVLACASPFVAWLTPSAGSNFVTPHEQPSAFIYCIGFAWGAVLFWLAWGVHRHLLAAWRVGFVGIAALWLLFVFQVATTLTLPGYGILAKLATIALIVAIGSLISLFWGWRWYTHRGWFTTPYTS